ncbi:MAG: 50S ribosomal protein L9 [Nitrospirae bacterium]|nr:50S ribosomal protein L9 [Nitrospirota bacterium]MCL5978149.1 50S ribosomal protein L9 [Nitrospirota bacterium]
MQVILKDNVRDVGHIGDMVNVKDGFARNFLIPKGLAVEANPKNLKALEHEKRKIQELVKKAKSAAEDMAAKISGTSITIKAKSGEEDKLFGSVTAMDIAEALKKEGLDIDKKKIVLDEPIKRLGSYTVNVKIHQAVSAQVNVIVEREA